MDQADEDLAKQYVLEEISVSQDDKGDYFYYDGTKIPNSIIEYAIWLKIELTQRGDEE